ncbi:MAG: STAS domain-containing protein [Gammaproteobacteria bacterium]|nr:STAS domain-containing protein [Gammaproteobacteria bacterium]
MANISVRGNSEAATIAVNGRFDFSVHSEFRGAYEKLLKEGASPVITIDMAGVDYVDSSALGMLLILRDRLGCDRARQRIINCSESVMEVFKVANFGQLFDIQA